VDKILTRINELNNLTPQFKQTLTPFIVDQDIYGYINADSLKLFKQYTNIFTIKPNYIMGKDALLLNPDIAKLSMEERTAQIHKVSLDFKEKKLVHGWRNEFVPIKMKLSSKPAFLIERSMYSLFGFKGYGCHVNGYVRNTQGEITHLWVGTRSKTKSTWPGMLDHIVAGGLPFGVGPMENVIKECEEEANIPEELALKSIPTGAVSYMGLCEDKFVKRDVLMVFDLELPLDFIPTPVDGEVEKFELHSIDFVLEHIMDGKYYKPNCHLVILDFLVR
jgi:8-oxo-dGTP pyrophosphatase MutT (NUDIX family)